MAKPTAKKVNLESLITKEELEELENIRVKKIPKQIEQIGEGASAKVFLLKLKDGSLHAGKEPKINLFNKSPKEKDKMKEHLSNALREIKILHQLDHDRIVKFFGVYLSQHQIMIFMEYMQGSVKDKIDENCLSEKEAMHYFIQAAEGLAYLHSRKPRAIIHRDIKCQNLLLTANNDVKLADFGLSIDLAISSGSVSIVPTAPTSLAGTQYFIAPEIIGKMDQPKAYGRKSDVWSLACTLVQMISGEPPYSNLPFREFFQRSLNISSNPSPSFKIFRRSSSDSSRPLKYSGDLLPTASNAIKQLLNSMFIVDSKLRPSAEDVLTLAHVLTNTVKKHDKSRRLKDDEPVQPLQLKNEKAVEKTNASVQFHFGISCDEGRSVPQPDHKAIKWYRKPIEQRNAQGHHNLGVTYRNGRGLPQSDEEAVKSYRKDAEQGNAVGQNNLGVMYQNGRCVPQSDEEAVKWYRKAAEQGNVSGQNNLGLMYEKGRGVPQSDIEAVKWYRKAAERGDALGQYNFGFMYEYGRGVSQSNEEANKWYRRAAEQGDPDYQENITLFKRLRRLM